MACEPEEERVRTRHPYRPYTMLTPRGCTAPERPRFAQATWSTLERAASGALSAASVHVRRRAKDLERIHSGVQDASGRTVWVTVIKVPGR